MIICGDALTELRKLPDASVHCCVTSPPYFGLRDYGVTGQLGLEKTPEEYVAKMVEVFREVKRILRDDGVLFINLGDSYASHSLQMQNLRKYGQPSRAGEGDVPEVLSQNGPSEMDLKEPEQREGEGGDLSSRKQGKVERPNYGTSPQNEGENPRNTRREMSMLRGNGANLSDDRPYPKRRGESASDEPSPTLQDDSGRGVSTGEISNSLLELQRGKGNSGALSPFGEIKQKDLVGIPWMVAFALRADGWYLRSDIIWAKPNPMPESIKDRPTRSHEYIFLMSKNARYYYDAEAVKEGRTTEHEGHRFGGNKYNQADIRIKHSPGSYYKSNGRRNLRSVWTITTRPMPKVFGQVHFATFPPDLIEPCIKAGCPIGGIVIDPFFGVGTTGLVAARLGREFVGIELHPAYCEMARKRIYGELMEVPHETQP